MRNSWQLYRCSSKSTAGSANELQQLCSIHHLALSRPACPLLRTFACRAAQPQRGAINLSSNAALPLRIRNLTASDLIGVSVVMLHDKPWDDELAGMLDSGLVSGYALLSHRGEPIAAHGALEHEFTPPTDADAAPAAVRMLELFGPRTDADEHSTAFELCGDRQQVCAGNTE